MIRSRDILFVCACWTWVESFRQALTGTACALRHAHQFSSPQPKDYRSGKALPFAVVLCAGTVGGDVVEACSRLRCADPDIVLVAVMEGPDPEREWQLLSLGVDDVVRPPVSVPVMAARTLLRIKQRGWSVREQDFVDLGGVLVDFVNGYVLNHGQHHPLSDTRARLLKYLLANPNRLVTRDEAYDQVWGNAPVNPQGKCLDMHISKLRQVIERDPQNPRLITTVYGRGYQMNLAEEPTAASPPPGPLPVRLNHEIPQHFSTDATATETPPSRVIRSVVDEY